MIVKVVLLFGLLVFAQADESSRGDSERTTCGLYLAESSIKNAGWGVFAGKDFRLGDHMGSKGIGIPVIDPESIADFGSYLSGYLWQSGSIGSFSEAKKVQTVLPGIAMLANHHPYLANIFESGLSHGPLLNRSTDPMAGSSTSYHGLDFLATQDISAGEELFVDSKQDWVGTSGLPSKDEYVRASSIVVALIGYLEKHGDLSEEQWIDILYRMRQEIMKHEPAVASLLPKTLKYLKKANQTTIFKMDVTERSLEWLEEHGKCLDNIREGESSIPGSGRGAFATRFLPKGSVVSPAPLMQIMSKGSLRSVSESNSSQQLLLNYCFGHRKSDMLLCPTTHVSLINHDTENANVEIRWGDASSNRENGNVDHRLESIESMTVTRPHHSLMSTRLSFDFVATRDILPDEEIYLNYGKEWEDAFLAHTGAWSRPESASTYTASTALNARSEPLMLSKDERMLTTHRGYECKIEPFAREEMPSSHLDVEEDYMANPSVRFENWNDQVKRLVKENDYLIWYPCEVVEMEESGDAYKTHVYSKNTADRRLIRNHRGVPRESVRYADRPYHSDQHLSTSFRHYVPIPDSMFPHRWRNDYRSADELRLGTTSDGVDVALAENAHLITDHENNVRAAKCGVYIAPSNIPNAGFGTYTAVPIIGKGIIIGTELPAIAFPRPNSNYDGRWDAADYIWNSIAYNAEYETDQYIADTVIVAVDNGALANFHPGLVNEVPVSSQWRPKLDRCTDSGAGAFSDYTNYSIKSTGEVDAGSELFLYYGENWIMNRPMFSNVPLEENYIQANNLLASIWSLASIHDVGLTEMQWKDLLELTLSDVVVENRTRAALRGVTTLDDLQHIVNLNGTAQSTAEHKTQEWFEAKGQCIDHTYVEDSTVRQAGKGAFSRRLLEQGTTITSTPLLATWGKHFFEIDTTDIHFPGIEDINSISLSLNYHLSHPDSSVYFFPLTQLAVINHNSDRSEGGRAPNARLKWATWNRKSAYYLERPLEDLKNEHYSTMMLDVVATRAIHPDEEVFIDYGEEWESAWDAHVQNYGNPCQSEPARKTSMIISSMNLDKFNQDHHVWSIDHFTVCQKRKVVPTDSFLVVENMEESLLHPESIEGYTLPVLESFSSITWQHIGFNITETDPVSRRTPCMILGASNYTATFDVVYLLPSTVTPNSGKVFRVVDLPADDLQFIPMPFRSDTFHKKSFRHPIKIPDDVFPEHWKDYPRMTPED